MKRIIELSIISVVILTVAVLSGCEGEADGSAPQNLQLTGTDYGQSVLLTWEEPATGIPSSYIIYFRECDSTDFSAIASLDGDALEYTHDPAGMTGDYYVAVESGSTVYSSETLTTVLVHTDALLIPELNANGEYGYGWALTGDFTGSTYSMTNVPNALLIDFYITNFIDDPAAGPWSGQWYIASPDTVTDDPGGYSIPQAAWRSTWFSDPLLDPHEILPNFGPTTYFKCTPDIEADTTYIGVFLDAEQHYGLVKFFGADTITGTIQIESWFQTVPDLRLVAH